MPGRPATAPHLPQPRRPKKKVYPAISTWPLPTRLPTRMSSSSTTKRRPTKATPLSTLPIHSYFNLSGEGKENGLVDNHIPADFRRRNSRPADESMTLAGIVACRSPGANRFPPAQARRATTVWAGPVGKVTADKLFSSAPATVRPSAPRRSRCFSDPKEGPVRVMKITSHRGRACSYTPASRSTARSRVSPGRDLRTRHAAESASMPTLIPTGMNVPALGGPSCSSPGEKPIGRKTVHTFFRRKLTSIGRNSQIWI